MLLSINLLRDSKLNSNVMTEDIREKLKENIKNNKVYPALIVRKINEPPSDFDKKNTVGEINGFRIIDGHNRRRVLNELKYEKVECDVWDIDDKTEMLLLATLNELKGTQDFSKRAILLQTINQIGISRDDLLKLIPEDSRRLEFILSLIPKDGLSEIMGVLDDVEQKRNALRERFISEGFSIKHAEAMADIYAFREYVPKSQTDVEGGKIGIRPILIFFFDSPKDFGLAVKYFEAENDKEPNTAKLIDLIK